MSTLTTGLVVIGVIATIPGAQPALANSPVITNVQFSGGTASPVVIVTGSGFGAQSDLGAPGAAGCGQTGSDFGNNLYIQDSTDNWLAGRGVACVGLFITSYSDTQVIFTFGSDYSFYTLSSGASFTLTLLGANFTGNVAYVGTSTNYYCNVPGPGLVTVPTIVLDTPTPPPSLTAPGTYRPALTVLFTDPTALVNAALTASVTEVSLDDATMTVAQDGGTAFSAPTEQVPANNLPVIENYVMNTPVTSTLQFEPMTWTSGPGIGTANFSPGEIDVQLDGNHGAFSESLQCFPPGPQALLIGGPSGPVPTLGSTTVSAPPATPAVQVPATTEPELPNVTAGNSVLWKILVSNTSLASDANVVASVSAVDGATPLPFDLTSMAASGSACSNSGAVDDHVNCPLGTLAPGASKTVEALVPTGGLLGGTVVSGQVSIAATGASTATGALDAVGVVSIPNTVIGAAVPGVKLTNTQAPLSNSNPVIITLKLPKRVAVSSLPAPVRSAGPASARKATGTKSGRAPGRTGATGASTALGVTGSAGAVSAQIGAIATSQDNGLCPSNSCYGSIAEVDGNFTNYTDARHPIKLQMKYEVGVFQTGTTLWMRKDARCTALGCTAGGVIQLLSCGISAQPCYAKLKAGGPRNNQFVNVKVVFIGTDPRFGLRA